MSPRLSTWHKWAPASLPLHLLSRITTRSPSSALSPNWFLDTRIVQESRKIRFNIISQQPYFKRQRKAAQTLSFLEAGSGWLSEGGHHHLLKSEGGPVTALFSPQKSIIEISRRMVAKGCSACDEQTGSVWTQPHPHSAHAEALLCTLPGRQQPVPSTQNLVWPSVFLCSYC